MCQVNMGGMPTDPEYREEKVITRSMDNSSHVEAITLPLHSRCVGRLGTESYFCQCERPFVEDISLPVSNCLLQIGSCDSKLCVHGACVTTANQRGMAVCMCYAGYTGPQCNQKVGGFSRFRHWICLYGAWVCKTRGLERSRTSFSRWNISFHRRCYAVHSTSMTFSLYPWKS